jgi:uncharacterized heparinase superfamily protein
LIKKFHLYWHTLRHLRAIQFYARLKHNIFFPGIKFSSHPQLRPSKGSWIKPIESQPSLVRQYTFKFFYYENSLTNLGWDNPNTEKLWRYNQHYFDDLNAVEASSRNIWHQDLMRDWIKKNPPPKGVGWDSYPISLRVVNWIKWSLSGGQITQECMQSLAIQVRYLTKRLEWHLLGNHIIANSKALIFAGLFYQGEEASSWLSLGLKIMKTQLSEQILEDGGHFERSPMYHSIVLVDLLDLINVARCYGAVLDFSVIEEWVSIVDRMIYWLRKMNHPDGKISFFNDAAFNIAPCLEDIIKYAKLLGINIKSITKRNELAVYYFKQSGYIRIESSDSDTIIDAAPVGPDYIPGHAHADTLSFETSLYGQRIIVNGGTSIYGNGPERLRERETRAHSTVEVAGISSSEVWSGFRVARRAKPFGLQIKSAEDEIYVSCLHDGYTRLKGKPTHHRVWILTANSLIVSDRLIGGNHKSIARFILHPSVSIDMVNKNEWYIYMPLGQRVLFKVLSGNCFVEPASYAPEFGKVERTKCFAIELILGFSQARLQWS